MDLYIGNAMKQPYDFQYRVPENPKVFTDKIQPGSFRKLSLNFSKEGIDSVLAQHAKYGLIPDSEIDQARSFHGTCYSVDKPIQRARLVYLMDRNMGELVQRGREIRKANAVAQTELLNTELANNGLNARVDVLDMTIQQENEDPRNDVPQMSVGLLVGDPAAVERRQGRARA
jgi:hypothetical protein